MEIRLQKLGCVIAKCWEDAEVATARAVAEKHPGLTEEQITFLFTGELRAEVAQASKERKFEQAFMVDLQSHFPDLAIGAIKPASGLVARVNLHSRQHEGHRSASDLGVIITRPSIRKHGWAPKVEVVRDRARAVMTQAKLGRSRGAQDDRLRWGRLTKAQERLIPEHHQYYALLLYRLGGAAGDRLAPFQWQLCRERRVDEIKGWLRSGDFPNAMSSADLIRALSTGTVGTDSRSVVDSYIDPLASRAQAIEIHVFWPDGPGPRGPLVLVHRSEQQARIVQPLS